MMQTNFTLYKVIILLIVIISFILMSIFGYYLYNIEKNHQVSFDETSVKVIEETDITQIKNQYIFQEKDLYHIFQGETKSEEEVITTVHLVEDAKEITSKDIKTYKTADLFSEESILNQWVQTCNQCEIIKIQPAVIEKELLWEITYNDVDNRYVFDYFLMADGTEYETINLKRNFK